MFLHGAEMLRPAAPELLLGAEAAQLQPRSAVLAGLGKARLLCVSDKDGALLCHQAAVGSVPCQHHHAAVGPVLVEELCPPDVPAWISPRSGTFVP